MKWQRARQSQNVEDRRGSGWRGDGTGGWRGGARLPVRGGGLGIGGLIAVVLIGWVLDINPIDMLGLLSQPQGCAQRLGARIDSRRRRGPRRFGQRQ